MHVIFISACEKKALKKTRAVLDSYAIRTGHSTWQAPMTMEGLADVRRALKQKGITRQTAVAAYINHGMRRMKLAWVVGAKHRFNSTGAYPVASTQRPHRARQVEPWVRAASLLAGAAGDMHDIGKASQHFQRKLSPAQAQTIVADDIRHEWLSIKLLQQLRRNGWNWQAAWQHLPNDPTRNILTLGKIADVDDGVASQEEAVDYLIVTHHGLLGADNPKEFASPPDDTKHVRKTLPRAEQLTCAGDLPPSIFASYQKRMARLAHLLPGNADKVYYKALSLHARNALIHADHTISAIRYTDGTPAQTALFANTCYLDGKRVQNQPLAWHLQQVGERASRIACQMMTDLNLAGLCQQTVEFIKAPTQSPYFGWQNIAGNALQTVSDKHPDLPMLVFNIAATGSGKTRMNLRAACTLRPDDPRICIALNLRSLTLQTGESLKQSMNLSDDELAVVIGDDITQELFAKAQSNQGIDDDENPPEPMFDAKGEDYDLPAWLNPLYETTTKRGTRIDHDGKTLLATPLLVSTIDYLIAAGEPHRQGHHVKALLRLISSDLILDEIDSYDPKALMAVLRLVQLAGMYGRHVICSSATLSKPIAISVQQAYASGIAMRHALKQPPSANVSPNPNPDQAADQTADPTPPPNANQNRASFGIAIIDNEVKPNIWQQFIDPAASDGAPTFGEIYQTHLDALQQVLAQKPVYRLAELQPLAAQNISAWQHAVLTAAQTLHTRHAWCGKSSAKRLSFGLVRVANIAHAVQLAHYFAKHWQHARIACYHANDWRINRFYKEQRLDTLLSRHKTAKKRPTGNETIEQDADIQRLLAASPHADVPFIVIATPVEEVGRDHDFDWAVIDASSVQSIVQTAGRVNRHRRDPISAPNIIIPQYNYRHCKNEQLGQSSKPAFQYPGYEGYTNANKHYQTHNLAALLPWQDNRLVIDARLRFDTAACAFARNDDDEIAGFCQQYFYPQDDPNHMALFSTDDVTSSLMTEQLYQTFTPLRDSQYQALYRMQPACLTEQATNADLRIEKYINAFDGRGYLATASWQDYSRDFTQPIVQPACPQAWLYLSPQQMVEQCQRFGIDIGKGCQIALTLYGSADNQPPAQWRYDEGFGVTRQV